MAPDRAPCQRHLPELRGCVSKNRYVSPDDRRHNNAVHPTPLHEVSYDG